LNRAFLAEAHDRALAKLFFDLADGEFDGFEALAVLTFVSFGTVNGRHAVNPPEVESF
jgi:hypothetical protein